MTAALVCAVVVSEPSSAASPKEQLRQKQSQAQKVLAQVNALDARLGATAEAWNGANYELGQAKHRLGSERAVLTRAERQQRLVLLQVRSRLVALYEGDPPPSALSIFLGSSSVSDAIDAIDVAKQVTAQDEALASRAEQTRERYAAAVRDLQATELQKQGAVNDLATQRARISAMLSKRRTLLSSIESQVATLRAAELRQQRILAAQARARLAREAAARHRQEVEQEQAAAAARRRAAEAAAAARAAAATAAAAKAAAAAATTAPDPPPATTAGAPTGPTGPTGASTVPTPPPSTAPVTTTPSSTPLPPGHPEAATIALRYLGIPYKWGGASPSTGFDCSGLVMYVYAQLGIALPHFAAAQYTMGVAVPRNELEPGDLVFFDHLNHVGIYIGGGELVHAPETGDVVKISNLSDWGTNYVGARRL